MTNVSLLFVAAAVIVGGWNFGTSWWKPKSTMERQVKIQGAVETPRSIRVDAEFDADFNALLRDLESAEGSASTELSELESQE